MNKKTLPMSLEEIVAKRNMLEDLRNKAKISKLKTSLQEMDKEYLHGQRNLKLWSTEILAKIDMIFIKYFMNNGKLLRYLFYTENTDYLNTYTMYQADVDKVLYNHCDELPVHCWAYFQYLTLWQICRYKFPVPLGMKTVIECLHKIAGQWHKGFLEVTKQ